MRIPRFLRKTLSSSTIFSSAGAHFGRQAFREFMTPRKPRHRALRVLLTLVGVGLLAVLLVFGLLIGAAMLGFTLVSRLLRQRGKPVAKAGDARTLDGEYRVLRKPVLTTGR
ncbi:hypothetical protein [Lysobacter brunescens]|uniref:Transmembrane protein n=1 Tax=Lysobacter brunescens TaxID=262323 RepID=A0ABW2YAX7_9GAMM